MRQLSKEEAVGFHESRAWETMSDESVVKLQLYQERLCLPFERFHSAMEKVLGRPVWTHEFASSERLQQEYEKAGPKPTFEEIVSLLPQDKVIIVQIR